MEFELYYAAIEADKAWGRELRRLYGSLAGGARYTRDGTATSRLRELYEAKINADVAWRSHIDEHRRTHA